MTYFEQAAECAENARVLLGEERLYRDLRAAFERRQQADYEAIVEDRPAGQPHNSWNKRSPSSTPAEG